MKKGKVIVSTEEGKRVEHTDYVVYSYDKNNFKFVFYFPELSGMAKQQALLILSGETLPRQRYTLEINDGKSEWIVPAELLGYEGHVKGYLHTSVNGHTNGDDDFMFTFLMRRSEKDKEVIELQNTYYDLFDDAVEQIQLKAESTQQRIQTMYSQAIETISATQDKIRSTDGTIDQELQEIYDDLRRYFSKSKSTMDHEVVKVVDMKVTAKSEIEQIIEELRDLADVGVYSKAYVDDLETSLKNADSLLTKAIEFLNTDVDNLESNLTETNLELTATKDEVTTQLAQKASKQEVEIERQRINAITRLEEGSTTADAELIDIRTGADGITYDSAGDAVRSQVSKINETIVTEVVKVKKSKNLYNPQNNVEKTITDGMVGYEHELKDSTTLLSQRIEIPYGKDITFYGVRSYSLVDKNNIITKSRTFIEKTDTLTLLWDELPSGTKYVWICTYIANSTTDTQVEIGTEKTEYEPFGIIENTFECNGANVPFVLKDDLKPIYDMANGAIGNLNGNILPLQNIEYGVFYSLNSTTNEIIRFENDDYFTFTLDVENNRDYFIHSEHTVNYTIILKDEYRNLISRVSIANSGTINTGTANKLIFSAKKYCLDDLVFSPDCLNKNSYYYKLPFIGVDDNGRIAEILRNMNVLYGKKYYAYGDSYTELTDVVGVTYDRIIRKRNYMLGENGGISGSTMAVPNPKKAEGDHYAFSISRYLAIPEDADYVTLAFGINDSAVCDLGTIDDTTNTTFYGAWNVVLEWILTNRPYTKVGIIIFSRAYNTFYRAILEIADKWGIPVLDTFGGRNTSPTIDIRATEFNYSPIAQQIRSEHFRMETNRLHPNSKAHEWNSTMIESFLRSL